jgi:hypothetical protein
MRSWLACAVLFLWGPAVAADSTIVKRAAPLDASALQRISPEVGGLERVGPDGFAGWAKWQLGYEVEAAVKHGGRYSARCANSSPAEHRGLTHLVEVNQQLPAPITAECWSKAEGVSEGSPGDYALYLDLEYTDGTPLWGRIWPFPAGTHDWRKGTVTVIPVKPIKRVAVHGIFRARTGVAWFDDFRLWEVKLPKGTTVFDGVPVTEITQPCCGRSPGPVLRAEDGFSLLFDAATGEIVTDAPGGFCLRDVAAKSHFVRPQGTVEPRPDGSICYEGRDDSLQLQISATYRVVGAATRIDGEVRDLTGKDRAITVYFTYPIEAVGWQWHDDQRRARRIEANGKYSNLTTAGAGVNGMASRYPLACISGQREAMAIAAPLDVPRLCRFGYDAESRELYAAIDLGLSPDTKKSPSRATFSLVLYRTDPEWGFRSAWQRYYQLFPQCFTKRNQKEGIWMPFTDIAEVEGFQDFGFQFKEGDNNVPFDAEHGIYSFVYVEPWSNWVRMPREMERTVKRATDLVAERAKEGSEKDQATFTSALEDREGQWLGRIENQPWCDGAVFGINPSPAVTPQGADSITQFQHLWRTIERAFQRNPQLSGVYHDSFEMYLFHQAVNYRRAHFAQTEIPLVFDSEGRVCELAMFEMVEFAREIARRMWPQGKMTFANGTPYDCPWGAAWLDVMGTEYNWAPGGSYAPPPDELVSYWRALSYQRPYLLLLNTDFGAFKPEWVELYMKRSAAYGLFPSFFSHNASEDPYFGNPALYNRDRPLFKKYLPIISALSAAGWEPVTYARSDNPKVYVERFGKPGGPLYLTLLNDSAERQRAAITLDLAHLRPGGAGSQPALQEALSGARLEAALSGDTAVLTLDIEAQDVKVLALDGSGRAS